MCWLQQNDFKTSNVTFEVDSTYLISNYQKRENKIIEIADSGQSILIYVSFNQNISISFNFFLPRNSIKDEIQIMFATVILKGKGLDGNIKTKRGEGWGYCTSSHPIIVTFNIKSFCKLVQNVNFVKKDSNGSNDSNDSHYSLKYIDKIPKDFQILFPSDKYIYFNEGTDDINDIANSNLLFVSFIRAFGYLFMLNRYILNKTIKECYEHYFSKPNSPTLSNFHAAIMSIHTNESISDMHNLYFKSCFDNKLILSCIKLMFNENLAINNDNNKIFVSKINSNEICREIDVQDITFLNNAHNTSSFVNVEMRANENNNTNNNSRSQRSQSDRYVEYPVNELGFKNKTDYDSRQSKEINKNRSEKQSDSFQKKRYEEKQDPSDNYSNPENEDDYYPRRHKKNRRGLRERRQYFSHSERRNQNEEPEKEENKEEEENKQKNQAIEEEDTPEVNNKGNPKTDVEKQLQLKDSIDLNESSQEFDKEYTFAYLFNNKTYQKIILRDEYEVLKKDSKYEDSTFIPIVIDSSLLNQKVKEDYSYANIISMDRVNQIVQINFNKDGKPLEFNLLNKEESDRPKVSIINKVNRYSLSIYDCLTSERNKVKGIILYAFVKNEIVTINCHAFPFRYDLNKTLFISVDPKLVLLMEISDNDKLIISSYDISKGEYVITKEDGITFLIFNPYQSPEKYPILFKTPIQIEYSNISEFYVLWEYTKSETDLLNLNCMPRIGMNLNEFGNNEFLKLSERMQSFKTPDDEFGQDIRIITIANNVHDDKANLH